MKNLHGKKKRNTIIASIVAYATSLGGALLFALPTYAAADTTQIVKEVTEGQGNGTFNDLIEKITAVGTDAYALATTICIIGLLLSLVVVGLTFVTSKNSAKRDEGKSWIFWVALGAAVVFGAGSIAELLIGIGASFTDGATGGSAPAAGGFINTLFLFK